MRAPTPLRDDPSASVELRQLLGHARRPIPLDRATRQRMGRRLDRYLALPLVLTLGLTMKTAAASVVIAAGAVSIGAVAVHEIRVLRSMSGPLIDSEKKARSVNARSAASVAISEALSSEPLPPPSPRATATFADPVAREEVPMALTNGSARPAPPADSGESKPVPPEDGLAREAAMLEAARRALATSPAEAIAIAEEHRAAYPRARLEIERELIRVDALVRLGQYAKARQIAETLKRHGGLYAERVQRLLDKMDADER